MVRDHRDAGEEVLERADEKTLAERMRAAASNGLVAGEPRPQVVDPFRRVRVLIAAFELPVVIELEMIVRVDEARQDDGAGRVNHGVAVPRRAADAQHARREADRVGHEAAAGDDARVDDRHRLRPGHRRLAACTTTTTGGLPHRC